ncbi:unnamed protein product [Clonostachys byssicola]|uniref:non-specific serine/threonine protein kinase n=1 Tax=Clonostachys byssicola TaxID=160290 RepID=A0A9N9UHH6_9HYPO|nr:unnamed protein product [Clonostachys byssicola]
MDQARLKTIEDNPIEAGLDSFREIFRTICQDRSLPAIPESLESLHENDLQDLVLDLLLELQRLPVARLLPSSGRSNHLRTDILKLSPAIISNEYEIDRIKPLLHAVVAENTVDTVIWNHVYAALTESTPPPQTIASSLPETPGLLSPAQFSNFSEYDQYMDEVLKEELGELYVGLPRFYEAFFGAVPELDRASKAVFAKCLQGDEPLFREGWRDWPADAELDGVLSWFSTVIGKLEDLADEYKPTTTLRRRPLAQPSRPIRGSTTERKLDVGFIADPDAQKDSRCHWSQILVPGELRSNPSADTALEAWLDLGRSVREVLTAQDNRRFVLGFTLCGSLMRIWEFDRLGGTASESFDINQDGEQFVYAILGFLWMSDQRLGFDPTIISSGGRRYIEIARNGQTERLILDRLIKRASCVAGRGTTCWQAHREEDGMPLVIKDFWEYSETKKNRVHQRIVVRDFGKPIYEASSRVSLLSALEACIEGHESLRSKAGILHRDISINNLMINEDDENPSWRGFLIDLGLAIHEQREGVSGARGRVGTRVFMAIGVLLGERHSFMHDIESFFWVLFWICIHYDGPHRARVVRHFDEWHTAGADQLADLKKGKIGHEGDFIRFAKENFTQYYQPLVPWVNRVRKIVFPNGGRWEKEDAALYSRFRKILRDAQEDPEVSQVSE